MRPGRPLSAHAPPKPGSDSTRAGNALANLDRLDLLQTRQDFFRKQADAFYRFFVSHVPGTTDQDDMVEATDLVVKFGDLAVHAVRSAGEQDPLLHGFRCRD